MRVRKLEIFLVLPLGSAVSLVKLPYPVHLRQVSYRGIADLQLSAKPNYQLYCYGALEQSKLILAICLNTCPINLTKHFLQPQALFKKDFQVGIWGGEGKMLNAYHLREKH